MLTRFIILTLSCLSVATGCAPAMKQSTVEIIDPASAKFGLMCGLATGGHSTETLTASSLLSSNGIVATKTIAIIGNIGGEFKVGESPWLLSGAGLVSGAHEHMIKYPRSQRIVVHDPDVINRVEMLRDLEEVIWK